MIADSLSGQQIQNKSLSKRSKAMNYEKRVSLLQQQIGSASLDLVFLPISADMQYLTGIPRDMPNYGATLYPGRWLEGAFFTQTAGPVLMLPRMTAEFHLEGHTAGDVHVIGDRDDPFALARDVLRSFNLGSKPHVAVGNYAWAESMVAFQNLLPGAVFSNAADLTRPLRRIKSAEEIEAMRRAGAVTEAAFTEVLKHLRHGVSENDISAEVDLQLRKRGALGPSFVTSMYNSGPNHKLGLGHANTLRNAPLLPPVSLLFDFGAAFGDYCYDYGRTVFFGQPQGDMLKVYDTVMASQRAGIRALCAGAATCQDVDSTARAVVVAAGYGSYFRHRLGHGIGMDVHEPPFLTEGDTTLLEEGMAFTVEPSIFAPSGFAARVEDIIIARPGGGEPLTTGFQTLIVVE
jgi:Xaa-Pro aminopeptidase